jgi:hypothetical protein
MADVAATASGAWGTIKSVAGIAVTTVGIAVLFGPLAYGVAGAGATTTVGTAYATTGQALSTGFNGFAAAISNGAGKIPSLLGMSGPV